MLRFFNKKKFKLYLGGIYVVEKKDLKSRIDQLDFFGQNKVDSQLYNRLATIFDLPEARDIDHATENDLAIDVSIPSFQLGAAFLFSLGSTPLPVFWRPQVRIVARIYKIKSNKTLNQVSVNSKLPWKAYFSRIFSLRTFFGLRSAFDVDDLESLLVKSCLKAVTMLRAKSYR